MKTFFPLSFNRGGNKMPNPLKKKKGLIPVIETNKKLQVSSFNGKRQPLLCENPRTMA